MYNNSIAITFKKINNSKTIKTLIVFMALMLGLSSCSITKCRYSKGFYIDFNKTKKHNASERKVKNPKKSLTIAFVKDTVFEKPLTVAEMPFTVKNNLREKNTSIKEIKSKVETKEILEFNKKVNLKFIDTNNREKINKKITNKKCSNDAFWSDFFGVLFVIFGILFLIGILTLIVLMFMNSPFVLLVSLLSLLSIFLSILFLWLLITDGTFMIL